MSRRPAPRHLIWLAGIILAGGGFRPSAAAESAPPQVKFELNFEQQFIAVQAGGPARPTNANLPELVEGVRGQAARFRPHSALRYPAPGNLDLKRGSLSLWLKADDETFAKNWVYLFAQDVTTPAGENPFCLWSVGSRGLRFDVRDLPGTPQRNSSLAALGESLNWRPGEWHQVICCWDEEGNVKLYVDGQVSNDSCTAYWNGRQAASLAGAEAFLLGAFTADGEMNWPGCLDEVRILDRPLNETEALAEYCRLDQKLAHAPNTATATIVDAYFWAGREEACRLVIRNNSPQPVELAPVCDLQDEAGNKLGSQELAPLTLAAGASQNVVLPLTLPEAGFFRLALRNQGEARLGGEAMILGLAPEKAEAGSGRRTLVAEVDAVAQTPRAESAATRIVDSPLGQYREAGENPKDRFAFEFVVREPHTPHIAVFEIPDDKPRTMETLLTPLERSFDCQGQSGIHTGNEYPLTHGWIEHTVTFWPACAKNSFVFVTGIRGLPAAIRGFKIYRLDGLAPLPVKPFAGSAPARDIGMYYEDPCLAFCFGSIPVPGRPAGQQGAGYEEMVSFPGFAAVADRLMDYLTSFGQNTLQYPIQWYGGPLYGSYAEPDWGGVVKVGAARAPSMSRPHPYDFPAYLLKRFGARGLKFNGWLHPHRLHSLAPYALINEEKVLAGAETVVNMRADNHLYNRGYHHQDPAYNPIDPRVEEAFKRIVAEILDRYGHEPAFEGITLNVVECSMLAFGSLNSGYNDINLRRFQADTGRRIPVDAGDPQRFAKSHAWLMANAREEWVAWRCGMIHAYYKELAGLIKAKRSDLQLYVSLYVHPVLANHDPEDLNYLSAGRQPVEWYREQGVDPALFARDEDITLVRHLDMRYRQVRGHGSNSGKGAGHMDAADLRTTCLAPELSRPFAELPAVTLNLHDVYWENNVGKTMKAMMPEEVGWRNSQLNANTFHALEQYAAGLNNLDPLRITKGGIVIGLNGMEPYLAAFAQAYRALPAVKFADVPELADPVRVRQKVIDGANYFYVLNRLPYPVAAELRLQGAPAVDLVSGERMAEGKFGLTLKPYELRAFRQAGEASRVTGGLGTAPAELVAELTRQVEAAEARLAQGGAFNPEEIRPYVQKARAGLDAREYARLYFLLQETWAEKLNHAPEAAVQSHFQPRARVAQG